MFRSRVGGLNQVVGVEAAGKVVVAVHCGGGDRDSGVKTVAVCSCVGSESGRAQLVVGGGKGGACQNGRWWCLRSMRSR